MAVLCLLTNTPWPWPTPAGAASARGGVPTRNEVEGGRRPVCTSAARKIGGPLVARQGRSPSAGLVSLLGAERMSCFPFHGNYVNRQKSNCPESRLIGPL